VLIPLGWALLRLTRTDAGAVVNKFIVVAAVIALTLASPAIGQTKSNKTPARGSSFAECQQRAQQIGLRGIPPKANGQGFMAQCMAGKIK